MQVIENKKPLFKRGSILDKEILENMIKTPYEYYSLEYYEYSDGVICGVTTFVENNLLIVTPGIIKYNNYHYKIGESIILEIPKEDGEYILKIKFIPPTETDRGKYLRHAMQFFFTVNSEQENMELELVRIKRREGAEVKNPEIFEEIDKEYNLINEINRKQSTASGVSFPEKLLKMFAKKVLETKDSEIVDEIFCYSVLNSRISRDALNIYFFKKFKIDTKEYSNQEIYILLKKILFSLKDSKYVKNSNIVRKNRMMVE